MMFFVIRSLFGPRMCAYVRACAEAVRGSSPSGSCRCMVSNTSGYDQAQDAMVVEPCVCIQFGPVATHISYLCAYVRACAQVVRGSSCMSRVGACSRTSGCDQAHGAVVDGPLGAYFLCILTHLI